MEPRPSADEAQIKIREFTNSVKLVWTTVFHSKDTFSYCDFPDISVTTEDVL